MIIRPKSALGLKYVEITRGRSDQGFEDGDTIPLSASRPTPVEFDEFTSMFNDDTRTAMQENLRGFGDAFAGRGESINTALGVLPALLRDIQPVAKNLASPGHAPQALLQRAGRRRAHRRARRRVAGQPVREPRHHVRRARRGRQAVHPGLDHRGRAGARPGDQVVPAPAPVPAQQRAALPRAAARRQRAARRGARPRRHVRERHAHPQALAGLQPPPRLAAAGAAALRQRPGGAARASSGWPRRSRRSTRRCSTSRPPSCRATTSPCGSATCRRCSARATSTAPGSASSSSPRRRAPTTRASPRRAPANGPGANYLHSDPYPNTGAPGQTKECEAGNEPWLTNRKVIGNVPGKQPNRTEGTK